MSHLSYSHFWHERETPDKLVTLKDGTKVFYPALMPPQRHGERVSSFWRGNGELDRYDLARAFGMPLGKFTYWRHRQPDFPQPCRNGHTTRNGKVNSAYRFWSLDEVLEWVENNLA
jgi:hypothetical protein